MASATRWDLLLALYLSFASSEAFAQAAANPDKPAPDKPAQAETQLTAGGYRKLALGIERTIKPESQEEERFSRHNLVGLLRRDPKFGERAWAPRNLAKGIRITHDIWALQFTFKPVRFIEIDIPDGKGSVQRKLVWYMVYHARNEGDKPVRFTPRFVLHAHDSDKFYDDRVMPLAIPQIQLREDPRRRLLNSVEMGQSEVPPSAQGEDNSVWGVVTWRDIDERTDRFSIFVQGLTNAYRIEELPGQNPDEPGTWKFTRKTLQLNFWRPSDEFYAHEREIRLGIPGDVDYRWVYK